MFLPIFKHILTLLLPLFPVLLAMILGLLPQILEILLMTRPGINTARFALFNGLMPATAEILPPGLVLLVLPPDKCLMLVPKIVPRHVLLFLRLRRERRLLCKRQAARTDKSTCHT
jgi:hypothetical protein